MSSTQREVQMLKAEMLCLGVVPSPDARRVLESSDQTFIHGTVFRIGRSEIVNTVVWQWPESEDPISRRTLMPPLLGLQGSGDLFVQGRSVAIEAEILSLGSAGDVPLGNSSIRQWFSLHSANTIFCAPVRQCIFIAMDKPCRFCTFEGGGIKRLSREDFMQALLRLRKDHPGISSVAIGGGTPDLLDMGASYFGDLAKHACASGLSCSVELVPPPGEEHIIALAHSGVSSLIMSLEVWSEVERAAWCLGKSVVMRSHYEKAWQWGIDHLGRGRVASVLLVGAEELCQTLKGASELIKQGVIPTLIPIRWYPESRFQRWIPVSPEEYLELSIEVSALLKEAGLSPARQPGCTACGGCSLEKILGNQ